MPRKTEDTKKEKTVYGTIVKFDTVPDSSEKIWYVQLDGAKHTFNPNNPNNYDGLIPISKFTSNVNVNNKVLVMIKDHTAIVTGNATSPSTDAVQVAEGIENEVSKIKTSSIALEDIRALWGVK